MPFQVLNEVIHCRDLWHALSKALPVTASAACWAFLYHSALFDAEFEPIASQIEIKHIFKFIPSDCRRYSASLDKGTICQCLFLGGCQLWMRILDSSNIFEDSSVRTNGFLPHPSDFEDICRAPSSIATMLQQHRHSMLSCRSLP